MSYDLMVFEPMDIANNRNQFMEWYEEQTKWAEGHTYDDPAITTPSLRAWFLEIALSFPPLNGPLSKVDLPEDEDSATDYSIGMSVIYCSFAWSKASPAYDTVFKLAQKHSVGFLDASSENAEVWLPSKGKLILAHRR
ncbi:MAG: hypothetical protein ACRD51_04350 [Candidatus Acidiferrum sp.]